MKLFRKEGTSMSVSGVSKIALGRRAHQMVLVSLFFVSLIAISVVSANAAGAPGDRDTARYIVVLEDSVKHPGAVAEAQVEQREGSVGFVYRHALNGYSAELPKSAVEGLKNDPRVKRVEPDARGGVASQTTPTGIDRIFATGNEALDIDEEDDLRPDVDVAVLDTGIDAEHPDLDVVGKIDCITIPGWCKAGGTDVNGHGTHVAGTIAALDNGEGVVGVAPGARLWSVKVLTDGGLGYLSQYIAGVDWITGTREDENPENDIEVANASLRYFTSEFLTLEETLAASVEAGVVHVAAAGNESEYVKYPPGASPWVITVSALADYDGQPGGKASPSCASLGSDDKLASFSNFGGAEVAAPGVCIYSTVPGGKYGFKHGTSMASPHVAGAAAILASQSSPVSAEDVEGITSTILGFGNSGWTDTSGDGFKEPLLDVGNEGVFVISEGGGEEAEPPSATTEAATSITASGAKLNGTVNPNSAETTYQFEYGSTASYGSSAPASPQEIGSGSEGVAVDETIGGLEPNTTYHFRVVATNAGGTVYGEDETFETQEAAKPSATTEAATTVTSSGAKLNGTVNPNGSSTTYQFEYGLTTSYGSKAPASPKGIGSGGSGIAVNETIGGLEPNTTYHFRVVATNAGGTVNGEDKTFKTQSAEVPTAITWPAYSKTHHSAKLNGIVYPNGSSTTYQYEYGLTTSYGSKAPASPKNIGSGMGGTVVPEPISGLEPNTTYHFRVVATSAAGTTYGEDESFVTSETPPASEWEVEPTPNATEINEFSDVSCFSASVCMAIGASYGGEGPDTLVEVWDGEGWSIVPHTSEAELNGVTCVNALACAVVGSKGGKAWVEVWNLAEEKWTSLPVPSPAGGTNVVMKGGSCVGKEATLECFVAGSYVEFGSENTLVARLKEGKWTILSTPNEGEDSALEGISCNAIGSCVAVGYSVEFSEKQPLALHWDGVEWSTEGLPSPEVEGFDLFLSDVSCTGAAGPSTACVASGHSEFGGPSFSMDWDGEEWSTDTFAQPPTSEEEFFILNGVSCVSESECYAVGRYDVEGGSEARPLIEEWNGGAWEVSPAPYLEGDLSTELTDASCVAVASDCVAVGYTSKTLETIETLALHHE